MKALKILSISLLFSLCACTEQFAPSGMHTTDGSYLTGPADATEMALVQKELDTQRANRRAGHGFTYNVDEGRKKVYYWGPYYTRHVVHVGGIHHGPGFHHRPPRH